jgi:hypothetical protein
MFVIKKKKTSSTTTVFGAILYIIIIMACRRPLSTSTSVLLFSDAKLHTASSYVKKNSNTMTGSNIVRPPSTPPPEFLKKGRLPLSSR